MICHQYKMKEKSKKEAEQTLFGDFVSDFTFSIGDAVIEECTRDVALPLVERYEWLGTLPVNYQRFVSLRLKGHLAGVVCFTESKFGGRYTLFGKKAICLGRGCTTHFSPKWAGSHLVSESIKMLWGKEDPFYVIAFSDWSAGEIGTIYQACNWTYLGHHKTKEWVGPDGKRYDINTPAVRAAPGFLKKKTGEKVKATKDMISIEEKRMMDSGFKKVEGPIRGKYAFVAGRKCAEKRELHSILIQHRKPYPKRLVDKNS